MYLRLMGLIGMFSLALWNGSLHSAQTNFVKLRQEIQSKMRANNTIIAVAYKNLNTGETFYHNEKITMHAASLMKVPVMIEVYKQAAACKFSLNDSVEVTNEFRSIVDGSPFSLQFAANSQEPVFQKLGQKMTYRDLTYYMITISSNLATNILIDLVGAQNVMKTMRSIHANDIRVLRGVEDIKAYQRGLNNRTTAFDMLIIMQAIARQTVVTPEACKDMLSILLNQKFKTKIPALLPKNIKVAHKTGSITAIDHDAAIIELPNGNRYILVIMTKGFGRKEAEKHIADISKRIFDALQSKSF